MEKERYKFLEGNLIKNTKGIDWKNNIGNTFSVIYEYEKYTFTVVGYDFNKGYVTLEYNGEIRPPISISNLKKCAIGKLVKKITNEFKIEVGQTIKDEKRDFIILDRKSELKERNVGGDYNCKTYTVKCLKCNQIFTMEESKLLYKRKTGCPYCCTPIKRIKLGVNTIWDTDRWMCDLGLSEQDAKSNTIGTDKKVEVHCPFCGKCRMVSINQIYTSKTISCSCNGRTSYPERLMEEILIQINLDYIREYSPVYLHRMENGKISRKRSDFYIPSLNIVIEMDGGINHKNGKTWENGENLDYFLQVDSWKDEQHKINNVTPIRIDCSESSVDFIKNSFNNTILKDLEEFSKINWELAEEKARRTNINFNICKEWNKGNTTIKELSILFKRDRRTIMRVLKLGNKYCWCNYIPKH